MRVLGHIHTFNDEDVIPASLRALSEQIVPVDEVVVVDNGSRDATVRFLETQPVTLLRHSRNLGTSGSVLTGFRYALEKDFDWIWVFDADTAPRTNALERLLDLYSTLSPEVQKQTWLLSNFHVEPGVTRPPYQVLFTNRGYEHARLDSSRRAHPIDATIWSGSLYKMETVKQVGLPSEDYVLDWAEYEYGYRGKRLGLKAFVDTQSLVDHNIRGTPALQVSSYRFGPFTMRLRELPPIRCYYLVRNTLYFWLYEYEVRNIYTLSTCFLRVIKLTLSFMLRPSSHRAHVRACLRGIRDGIRRDIHKRY